MDPAAIGTALIGLEAIRRSDDLPVRPARTGARRRTHRSAFRAALAGTLRTLADSLEARPREAARGE
jgi:hypothetical protein